VKSHHASSTAYRIEQSRDVGEPDERFGLADYGIEVHPIEQAGDSVSAPDAPHGSQAGVLQSLVEVEQALIIGTGQVAVVIVGIFA
jgi:hypothetical protein